MAALPEYQQQFGVLMAATLLSIVRWRRCSSYCSGSSWRVWRAGR